MSNRAAVAIFVKTPGLSPLKTRLSQTWGEKLTHEFYRRALSATESLVKSAREILLGQLDPYWAVAEDAALEDSLWSGLQRCAQGSGALGDRLDRVYRELLAKHSSVFLMGADSPFLDVSALVDAVDRVDEESPFLLGPCPDGGYYLFGGARQVETSTWLEVPYSCKTTFNEFLRRLEPIGAVSVIEPVSDIDTEKDLREIVDALSQNPRRREAFTEAQVELYQWLREKL